MRLLALCLFLFASCLAGCNKASTTSDSPAAVETHKEATSKAGVAKFKMAPPANK